MIYLTKIFTFFTTLLTNLVYNFHKHISNIKTKRNIKYSVKKNKRKLDVHYQSQESLLPCIIYFHGGGWMGYSKGIYTTLTRRLAKMGYVVFNVNYPLAPKAKMDEILSECETAVKYVKKIAKDFGGDSNRIILAGDSAGAHISSYLAAKSPTEYKALLLYYGVYDLNTMMTSGFPNIRTYAKAVFKGKGKDMGENEKYSTINKVGPNYPPCLLASGEIDKLHASQSQKFYEVLEKNNIPSKKMFFPKKELRAMHAYMVFDGLFTNEETLKATEQFLKEVVK